MRNNIKYVFLLVVIVTVFLFFYMDKILLFGYLDFEKYKYTRDDHAFIYIAPNDRVRNISDSYCLNVEKELWENVKYKDLNMLVPSYGQYDKSGSMDSPILSIKYDDGSMLSAFISSIDKSMFDLNGGDSGEYDYSEINQYFKDFTKLDVLEYVLSSSPDDLSAVNNPMLLTVKVVALEVKRGIVPSDVKHIEKIFINKKISGVIVRVLHDSSRINIAYIYDSEFDNLYQINFFNINDDEVDCVLKQLR